MIKETFMPRNGKKDILFVQKMARGFFAWNMIYHIIEQGFKVFIGVFFIRVIMNDLQAGKDIASVFRFLLLSCGIFLLKDFYYAVYLHYLKPLCSTRVMIRMRGAIYEKADGIPLHNYESPEFYGVYEKAVRGKEQYVLDYADSLCGLAASLGAAMFLTVFFLRLDVTLMVFVLIPVAAALILGKRMNQGIYQRDMECIESQKKEKYVSRSFASKGYAQELRTIPMYSVLLNFYRKAADREIGITKKYGNRLSVLGFVHTTIGFLFPFLGSCIYLSYRVFVSRDLLVGDFASLSLAVLNFAQILLSVVYGWQALQRSRLYLQNIHVFLEQESGRDQGDAPKKDRGDQGVPLLEVRNLSYRYPGSEREVLRNVSLKVRRGEKIAIVGYNGAGKTTLIHILLKLLSVEPGKVFFDGQDLACLNEREYQRLWSTVMQDFRMFAMPLSRYLTEGQEDEGEDGSAERMRKALERADMEQVVGGDYGCELTKEFQEDGVVLSKGQQQRLAFARYFYRDTDMAVLDEPSSALDPVHEQKLLNELLADGAGKTLILISHRLSCVTEMDRIYFLHDGQIAEYGKHEELMRLNGRYADMFAKQSSNYELEEES